MTVKKIVRQNPRKVGRPVTVAGEKSVTIRLPEKLLDAIDASGKASRSEAIRHLVERGLAAIQIDAQVAANRAATPKRGRQK